MCFIILVIPIHVGHGKITIQSCVFSSLYVSSNAGIVASCLEEIVFKYVWFQSFDEETYGPKLGSWEFLSNTLIM